MGRKSAFFSDDHDMLVDLGYPTLDIIRYWDGSWSVIEVLNGGYIPSETPFRHILMDIQHTEINRSNVQRLVEGIDVCRQAFWDREDQKTKDVDDEHKRTERHYEDLSEQGSRLVLQNDDLMQRIARKGISEMNVLNILKHIPRSRF